MAVPLLIGKSLTVIPPLAIAAVLVAQEAIQPAGVRMDPTLFAAAVVTVIAALGGMIIQIINSRSAASDRREAARERLMVLERTGAVVNKADHLIEKTAEIHAMTNSTNSNLQEALKLLTEKLASREEVIALMEKEKVQTAATRAVTDLQAGIALRTQVPAGSGSTIEGAPATAVVKSLEQIDANTEAIENNTAKTEEKVAELAKE